MPKTLNEKAVLQGGLQLPSGAAVGKVLGSDASGNASWQTAASGASASAAIPVVETFGHSYAARFGASTPSQSFTQQLAKMLHAIEDPRGESGAVMGWAEGQGYNLGDGGWTWMMRALARQRNATAAPYIAPSSLGIWLGGLNDIARWGATWDVAALKHALRHWLAIFRCGAFFEETDSHIVLANGTWATFSSASVGSPNASSKYTYTVGATCTLTLPADFPGGTIWLFGVTQNANPNTIGITVDGVAQANYVLGSTDAQSGKFNGCAIPVRGLAAGARVIVFTKTAGSGFFNVDGWGIESYPDPPLALLVKQPRTPSALNYGAYAVTDANIATLNTGIAAVAAEFDRFVATVDVDATLNKSTTFFAADGLHPNDRGHDELARACYLALGAMAVTPDEVVRSGAGPGRRTRSYATASLAAGATETGVLSLGTGYRLYRLDTTYPARVRFYTTAAKRTADAARAVGVDPTGDHGCVFEAVTSAALLGFDLSPVVLGDMQDLPLAPEIPISITNLDNVSRAITASVLTTREE